MEANFATIWESIADVIGNDDALVQGDRRTSWRSFDERAARLAQAFVDAGVGPGAKIAEFLFNSPEYMEVYFAALKQRCVPLNVNYRYVDDELVYLLDNSDAEVVVFHTSLGDRVERIRDQLTGVKLWVAVDDGPSADGSTQVTGTTGYEELLASASPAPRVERSGDDISMTYTGGTTGMPKGVMAKVGPVVETIMATTPPLFGLTVPETPADIAAIVQTAKAQGVTGATLPACPLMHGTGMGLGALPALTMGGTIVLLAGRGLDIDELWSTVEREAVMSMVVVGDTFARPMLAGLRNGPKRDLDSLKLMVSAGTMFSEDIRVGIIEQLPGVMILDFFAATEGAMGIALSMAGNIVPTGRFTPNPGVVVLTEDDRVVAAGSGESGMIACPGAIPEGYYKDAAKTDKTFRVVDGVRYSIPGDWATVEADGSVALLGRGSQCINTGGEKVFPEEVEETIKTHPAVDDCLIFGVPDERFGQRVVGVASVHDDVDSAAIVDASRTKLSAYKLPRTLVLVPEVPRAPNGKADYPAAKELFTAAQT